MFNIIRDDSNEDIETIKKKSVKEYLLEYVLNTKLNPLNTILVCFIFLSVLLVSSVYSLLCLIGVYVIAYYLMACYVTGYPLKFVLGFHNKAYMYQKYESMNNCEKFSIENLYYCKELKTNILNVNEKYYIPTELIARTFNVTEYLNDDVYNFNEKCYIELNILNKYVSYRFFIKKNDLNTLYYQTPRDSFDTFCNKINYMNMGIEGKCTNLYNYPLPIRIYYLDLCTDLDMYTDEYWRCLYKYLFINRYDNSIQHNEIYYYVYKINQFIDIGNREFYDKYVEKFDKLLLKQLLKCVEKAEYVPISMIDILKFFNKDKYFELKLNYDEYVYNPNAVPTIEVLKKYKFLKRHHNSII